MREKLKVRNLEILSRFHELNISTKKQIKEIRIVIAESMGLTVPIVKNVVDRYYTEFLSSFDTKNLNLGDLTSLREQFKYENFTEKQKEYIINKLFGVSDTKATEKAGYKSKSAVTALKNNFAVQEIINKAREKVLKTTDFTFAYNFNTLGEIANKAKESVKERSIKEEQGGKNGASISKTITEKYYLGVAVNAITGMNKMIGYNYEDALKSEKLKIDMEKVKVEKHKAGLGDKQDMKKLEDFDTF